MPVDNLVELQPTRPTNNARCRPLRFVLIFSFQRTRLIGNSKRGCSAPVPPSVRHWGLSLFPAEAIPRSLGATAIAVSPTARGPISVRLHPRNVLRTLHELLKAAKLPRVRFHDLRHSAASLLIA